MWQWSDYSKENQEECDGEETSQKGIKECATLGRQFKIESMGMWQWGNNSKSKSKQGVGSSVVAIQNQIKECVAVRWQFISRSRKSNGADYKRKFYDMDIPIIIITKKKQTLSRYLRHGNHLISDRAHLTVNKYWFYMSGCIWKAFKRITTKQKEQIHYQLLTAHKLMGYRFDQLTWLLLFLFWSSCDIHYNSSRTDVCVSLAIC